MAQPAPATEPTVITIKQGTNGITASPATASVALNAQVRFHAEVACTITLDAGGSGLTSNQQPVNSPFTLRSGHSRTVTAVNAGQVDYSVAAATGQVAGSEVLAGGGSGYKIVISSTPRPQPPR